MQHKLAAAGCVINTKVSNLEADMAKPQGFGMLQEDRWKRMKAVQG
jgi:hypothetical protein